MALHLTASQLSHTRLASGAARLSGGAGRVDRLRGARPLRPSSARMRQLVQTRAEADGVAAEAASGLVSEVNDETFEEVVLQSKVPVIVDFWAPWCGPCRMIAPLIDELAAEYGDKLLCVKLNTDESPNTASTYSIRSIPTVLLFKNGEKVDSVIGAVPKKALTTSIGKFLE